MHLTACPPFLQDVDGHTIPCDQWHTFQGSYETWGQKFRSVEQFSFDKINNWV